MNKHWIGIALSATLSMPAMGQERAPVPAASASDDTADTPVSRLEVRLLPDGPRTGAGDLPGQAPRGFTDAESIEWRKALAQPDLDRRLAVYLLVVERAAADPRVEQLLMDWAHDQDDLDLAWTARLGLRAAQDMRIRARRGLRRQNDLFAGLGVHIEELPHGIMVALPRTSKPGARPGRSSSRILRLQMGPAGVKVELRNTGEGDQSTRVFEAANLEQLLEEHPELARDLASVRLVPERGGAALGELPGQMQFRFDALWSGDAGLLRTDILGIQMRELMAEAQAGGEAPTATGLLVERVLPDTIAEVIALRRGDLLLELNTVALQCGDDVSGIIKGREPTAAITVKLERDGVLRTFIWKPSIAGTEHQAAPADAPLPASPVTGGD